MNRFYSAFLVAIMTAALIVGYGTILALALMLLAAISDLHALTREA